MMGSATPKLTDRIQTDWHEQAACRHKTPEQIREETDPFFHPDKERPSSRRQRDQAAKRVCADCPVKLKCRDDARARRETWGVWGGESEDERAAWLNGGTPRPTTSTIIPGTPCAGGCGKELRTRVTGEPRAALAPGEDFHHARGLCPRCYEKDVRRYLTVRLPIRQLGNGLTLPQLIAQACDGPVQQAARDQGMSLASSAQRLSWRVDQDTGELVAQGWARISAHARRRNTTQKEAS